MAACKCNDESGKAFGTHGKGPTWTAIDGSQIVADGSSPLSRVTATSGSGVLSGVLFVQRLDTVGGAAPDVASCDAAHLGELRAVHYAATYRFFKHTPIVE